MKNTDAVDGPSQVVYDNEYDLTDIESPGSGSKTLWTLTNTLLVKLPSGGDVCVRAVNQDGSDIRIPSLTLLVRKVSTSTT